MSNLMSILAQSNNGSGVGGAIGGLIFLVIWLAVVVLIIAGFWKTFVKAGQPGWAAIVPIYNIYILTKIVGRPAWWVILFFIPFIGLIPAIIVSLDVAKAFGKSTAFAIGLILLSPIFYCILGFGDAQYQGPVAANKAFV
jgi:hypothetical protein